MAASNTVMSIVMTIGAIVSGNKKAVIVYGTLSILSLFTFCRLYNYNCTVDVIGDKGSARIGWEYNNPEEVQIEGGTGSRFPENPNELFPENYAGLEKEVKANGKINYIVQAGDKTYKIEYHPQHEGDGHYNGNHYHVLKLGEYSKPGKTKPPYFRIPNLDSDSPAQGGTFAPGDLLPTQNKK